MDDAQFRILLDKGIKELYTKDKVLLDSKYNINERTITHRLALHLTSCFSDYDVDCEYNRMAGKNGFFTEGDYWAKTVNLSDEPIPGDEQEAKTVFPDIIIHKRKRPTNLAIIEVKMQWKNRKKDFDKKKLRAYKADLKYNYAVFLEIGEKECLIEFI